eukprot:8982633-Alexandrium_andersonii.AAC.1
MSPAHLVLVDPSASASPSVATLHRSGRHSATRPLATVPVCQSRTHQKLSRHFPTMCISALCHIRQSVALPSPPTVPAATIASCPCVRSCSEAEA